MKITKDLKIAFQVDTEGHGSVLIYSPSITRDTFELYYKELGRVFADCFGGDENGQHLALVGPQMAYAALKSVAREMGTWDNPSGVQNGLINEIVRLTQVAYATDTDGWKKVPMATARAHGILDEDAAGEVLNSLVFFTAVCKVAPPKLAGGLLPVIAESFGWAFGSWGFSEYIDSLPKSTPAEISTMPEQSVIA